MNLNPLKKSCKIDSIRRLTLNKALDRMGR